VLGPTFDRLGWPACVMGVGLALALAALLGVNLRIDPESPPAVRATHA
jgi:YNFM family putative membrane transporter